LSGSQSSYRDRIYIVKDIILKLAEHNELNQTTLLSFCGLNLNKHKSILDELESNGFIRKHELPFGKRSIFVYRPTPKGLEFCTTILEPYEMVFPRRKFKDNNNNNNNNNNYQDHLQHYVLAQKRDTDEAERQKNIVEVVRNR
jgi:predicted transcriptional regulator